MPRPGDDDAARTEPEVSLGDAGIAAEIARAAARGRGADRTPTLEQLLAAFGEPVPTDAARRRVAAALEVAGMGVRPGLLEAQPGQRLLLLPPGTPTAPGRALAVVGLLAVVAILAVAAGAAALLGGSDDRASDSLPAGATTGVVAETTGAGDPAGTLGMDPAGTTGTDAVPTTDTEPGASATTSTTDPRATTTTAAASAEQQAAEARRRKRARREREAAAAAERRRKRRVTVVVDASAAPTFLCADDGAGTQLYGGTLSGRETFTGKRVRLNIGLASTKVTVDGTPVALSGSPAGLDITRSGGAQSLPLGQRPCG